MQDKPETDKRCSHSAKFHVGDGNYCTRHAGIIALRYLVDQSNPDTAQKELF